MKNLLKKTMACSLIAVITNSVLANEIKLQAVLRYKQNEVMDKFAHDARAFEQYAALGKESCYSQLFAFNRIKRTDEIPYYFYSSMYNEGDPFVHILPIKSISDSLLAYDDEQKVTDKILKRGVITYSEYYAEMKKCDAKFDVTNEALHEAYLKLVTIPKNYDTSYSEYEIDLDRGYRDDFLERYFIHKDVDGCPHGVCI
jgi:hypothetical protein